MRLQVSCVGAVKYCERKACPHVEYTSEAPARQHLPRHAPGLLDKGISQFVAETQAMTHVKICVTIVVLRIEGICQTQIDVTGESLNVELRLSLATA